MKGRQRKTWRPIFTADSAEGNLKLLDSLRVTNHRANIAQTFFYSSPRLYLSMHGPKRVLNTTMTLKSKMDCSDVRLFDFVAELLILFRHPVRQH